MHPVESFMYYTAMLIPVYFGAHPIVMLYTKMDLTLAALIGHDGFAAPGAASTGHWLHHKLINVNVSFVGTRVCGASLVVCATMRGCDRGRRLCWRLPSQGLFGLEEARA